MTASSFHTAPGPLAGFLFQPERALFHLATSPQGSLIGIETLDDITVSTPNGLILEQNKHYLSDTRPLADRSKEFWNSISIWLNAIANDEIDLAATRFFLVTNKEIASGLVFELMELGDETSRRAWIANLRIVGRNPPKTIKAIFESVLGRNDDELLDLIERIHVVDGSASSHGEDLKARIADHLHLANSNAQEIIQSLLGWVHDITLQMLRSGAPAWLSREAFDERFRRLVYLHQDQNFIQETAEAMIEVTDEARNARRDKLFVKQLLWLGLEDNSDQIIEAIDDHVRSGTEAIRLSQKGVVSPQDFRAFDDRLIKRWKNLARLHIPRPVPADENVQKEIGLKVLNNSMGHCEPLAGQPTTELYLTQGAYHRLADNPPQLGWHPDYMRKAAELK